MPVENKYFVDVSIYIKSVMSMHSYKIEFTVLLQQIKNIFFLLIKSFFL